MIKLYGRSKSRASRSLWMLEELGVQYEHIPIQPRAETRSPDFLQLNPNGRVPCLDDDGYVIWESLAINLYLAEKYGAAPLWPSDVQAHGRAYQWSLWAANEMEPRIITAGKAFMKKQPDRAAITASVESLASAIAILETHLDSRAYLTGDAFTVADLNLASTMREPHEDGISGIPSISLARFPNVARWLDDCGRRPANRRVVARA